MENIYPHGIYHFYTEIELLDYNCRAFPVLTTKVDATREKFPPTELPKVAQKLKWMISQNREFFITDTWVDNETVWANVAFPKEISMDDYQNKAFALKMAVDREKLDNGETLCRLREIYTFDLERTSCPISDENTEVKKDVNNEEASYRTETFFVKNNEFDKHNRRFSTDVLYKLADMLTGKTSGPFLIKNAYVKFTDKMTKAGPPLCELYAEIITPSDFDAEGKTLYVELNYQCVQSFLDDAGCEILVNDVEDFFFKTDEKTFSVPVLWTLSAKVTVKGKNLSEAVSKVTDPSFKLPKNGEYLEDSFCVGHEGIEEIKEG